MARVPTGIRAERGVETMGLGKRAQRQASPGDLPIPGAARDPGLRVSPAQFGAQIGGALQGLGAEVGNIAAAQKMLEDRRQAAETGVALTRARSKLNQRYYEETIAAQGEFEAGGNFLDIVTPRFDQARAEVLAEIQGQFKLNEEGLARFDQIAIGLTEDYSLKGITFEHNQRIAAAERAVIEEIDGVARSVIGNGDIQSGYAVVDAAVTAASSLFTPDQEAEIRSKGRERVARAYVEGRLLRDPENVFDGLNLSDQSLVGAVISQESGGDSAAISPKGAVGLMQVMPDTAREIARELGDENFPHDGTNEAVTEYLKDADINTQYGTHYLRKQLRNFDGDVEAALIAYNGGPERAKNWLAAGRDDSVIPDETSKYYKEVLDRMSVGGDTGLDAALKALPIADQFRLRDRAERFNNVRRRRFLDQFEDHVANLENFGEGLEGFDIDSAAGFMNAEEFAEIAIIEDQAFRDHQSISVIRFGGLDEAFVAVEESTPVPGTENVEAQITRNTKFTKMLRDRIQIQREDPAGYTREGFEDVKQAYDEFLSGEEGALERAADISLETQRELDVRPRDMRILPVDIAKAQVAEILAAPSDKQAGFIFSLMNQAGKHRDRIANELRQAGLTPGLFIAANNADNPALAQLIVAATRNAKEIEDVIGKDAAKTNDETITDLFEPFATSFSAGDFTASSNEMLAGIKETIVSLANLYVQKGDPNGAQRAYDDVIGDQFIIGLFGGTGYAPRFIDGTIIYPSTIENAAEVLQTRENLEGFDFVPFGDLLPEQFPEFSREITLTAAMNFGYWVTDENGLGAVLVVPIDGLPLRLVDAEGNPYGFQYDQAHTLGRRAAEPEIPSMIAPPRPVPPAPPISPRPELPE